MRPIEAGCLAIIIGGNYISNIGREVRVEKRNEIETSIIGEPVWIVSPTSGNLKVRTNSDNLDSKEKNVAFALERNLMRIDGGKPDILLDVDLDFEDVKEMYHQPEAGKTAIDLPEPTDYTEFESGIGF